MTNEQLAILLQGLYAEYGEALHQVREALSAELAVDEDAPIAALRPLEAVQALLWERIEVLLGSPRQA